MERSQAIKLGIISAGFVIKQTIYNDAQENIHVDTSSTAHILLIIILCGFLFVQQHFAAGQE